MPGAAAGSIRKPEKVRKAETLGRILDTLGCTLTPVIHRFAPKPVGRPRKYVHIGKVWDDDMESREGNFYVTKDGDVLEVKEEDEPSSD